MGIVGYIDIVVGSDVGVRRITEVHFVLQNMGQFASEGIFHWCPHEILRVAFRSHLWAIPGLSSSTLFHTVVA